MDGKQFKKLLDAGNSPAQLAEAIVASGTIKKIKPDPKKPSTMGNTSPEGMDSDSSVFAALTDAYLSGKLSSEGYLTVYDAIIEAAG